MQAEHQSPPGHEQSIFPCVLIMDSDPKATKEILPAEFSVNDFFDDAAARTLAL